MPGHATGQVIERCDSQGVMRRSLRFRSLDGQRHTLPLGPVSREDAEAQLAKVMAQRRSGVGVLIRHGRTCCQGERAAVGSVGPCTCEPSYEAWVYEDGKKRRHSFRDIESARRWREQELRTKEERATRRALAAVRRAAPTPDVTELYALLRRAGQLADRLRVALERGEIRVSVEAAQELLTDAEYRVYRAVLDS